MTTRQLMALLLIVAGAFLSPRSTAAQPASETVAGIVEEDLGENLPDGLQVTLERCRKNGNLVGTAPRDMFGDLSRE